MNPTRGRDGGSDRASIAVAANNSPKIPLKGLAMLSKSMPPISAAGADLFDSDVEDDCNGEESFLRNFEDLWSPKSPKKTLMVQEEEKEERYPDDLEQPTTKPSSLDGDADTQNDAKKIREQEERIVALTNEGMA